MAFYRGNKPVDVRFAELSKAGKERVRAMLALMTEYRNKWGIDGDPDDAGFPVASAVVGLTKPEYSVAYYLFYKAERRLQREAERAAHPDETVVH